MKKYLLTFFLIPAFLLITPGISQASNIIPDFSVDNGRVSQTGFVNQPDNLNHVLSTAQERFLTAFYRVMGALAIIMLVYSGIQYITAGASADKVKRARQNIINVIYGIILLISSYALIAIILSLIAKASAQTG